MPEQAAPPRPRAFWSGTITFGLVSVPVDLYPAQRRQRVSLRMLSPEGTPLRRRYYDPESEKEIGSDDIVRGYEVAPDRFVVVTDEELESLAPEKSRDIDLRVFVPLEQLDPMFFDRAYFLTPAGGSTKAYRLLARAMEETGRAGIATFVMRGKEYLVAILAENGILRAETLRFADELRSPADVGLPDPPDKLSPTAVKRVRKQIDGRTRKELDTSELEDRYGQRVRALAEAKRKRGEDVVTSAVEGEEEEGGVIDLMEVLKRSMREADERRPARRVEAEPSAAAADLGEQTKAELYERAKQLDVPGRSSMSKEELIRAIRRSA